ncbi:MAG: restriction endonuclease subunit S, partial [Ruminococcus flavefaciens]|nr:restriction endonuclease subunit S [Ruminococcus flavefaciens]
MARGEKKKELSLEEKLAQALVPVEEQPYEVPENWCWTYQNVACQLGDGEKRSDEEYPYLEVKYLRGHKDADIKKTGKYIESGTKIILVDGENSGEVFEVSEDGYMGSTFKTLNISFGINEKYLLYFVDSKRDLLRKSKTGSAIPHLNKKLFFSLEFPLPPLQEQQRIVERIESLFAKLDEVKEKLKISLDKIEIRKKSILHRAFQGELTAWWRYENNVDIDTWRDKQLDEVCKSIFDGDHMPPPKSDSGIH